MAVFNRENRTRFEALVSDVTVLAGADPSATLWTAKTGYTFYVTYISVSTTTDNAATLTFQDTAGTPVVIAKQKASPGVGQLVWEFGDDGTPLTADKGLALAASAAGLAARVHVEGYSRPTPNSTIVVS